MKLVYHKTLDDIVVGCQRNDRNAQRQLYERLYGQMMALCMRYASDPQQAQEILNRGFLKVYTHIKDYQPRDHIALEAWVHRILVNTAIDHLRAEMRHQHSSLDQSIYVEATGDVLGTLSGEEILKMVNGLSPAYRAVFNLHVIEGYSHSEIAALLGIEEGTSKSNLAKAKVKLQKMILTHQAVKTEQYGRESQR